MRGLNVVLPFQQPRFERHRLIGRRVSSITVPVQSVPRSLSSVRGRARDLPWVEAICASTLGAVVALYAVVYSSLSIAAYRTGRTLFDLAAFEQSFWNATQGRLFSVSLEVTRPDLVVQMSHFGRHFSPIFFLLLPVYATYQHPSTLLVLQSLALGGAAIPLYLFARERLRSPVAALVIAVLYLASPAVHDVNTVNEFHELSFVIPLVFLAFYAIETERWLLYGVAVAGMLCVKEDVALTVCALGVYVAAVAGRRMLGLATLLSGGAWFVAVTLFVIPAFRGVNGPIPFLGYEYLGNWNGRDYQRFDHEAARIVARCDRCSEDPVRVLAVSANFVHRSARARDTRRGGAGNARYFGVHVSTYLRGICPICCPDRARRLRRDGRRY